ncbi:hypothetical protein CQ020_03860 [Arthrobacter sp. MYb23]|uniref:M23 family metallopeptidase n=1 Tax=unclassified Arthrobacter TaxID=235627 RepID=UPI000CFCC748|nr:MULTISPECIES: M23 family metallopeptidase [unclassified Arthrobacter]PRB44355.1 hypothetical protein CQ038_03715 [Arthrobacter sp. MYb51]PRB98607.1 hypothetical protein CQ020_03860 [Arthrobacter sp. MYb23]
MIHPVDYAPSQDFGDNPTKDLPASHWIIKQFGNYQPDGHTGVDYPCPSGTPVRAVTSGTVIHVGWYGGTYASNPFWISPSFAGYCYVVDHGWFFGIYGHCMDGGARVKVGQQVAEGQVLGTSGNTGASTGDHLHFEALLDGYLLNGYMYGRTNPDVLFSSIAPAGTTTTPIEEDDMFTDLDRERLNWLWETVSAGKSGYKAAGSVALDIAAARAASEATLAQVLPGESGVRSAGPIALALAQLAAAPAENVEVDAQEIAKAITPDLAKALLVELSKGA